MNDIPQKQRVWFVSELYYPELTSTGYFVTNLAEGLADTYEVSALCCQPTYLLRGVRAPIRELRNGVDIHRCWTTTLDKNKLVFRVINLVVASLSMFITALLKFKKGDVVLAVTNPPLLPYLMVVACRIRGSRFALRVEDVYPDVFTRVGLLNPNALAVKLMERAGRWLYKNSTRIIVLGRDMQALVCSKLDIGQDRVVLVTNWGDVDSIAPRPLTDNQLLRKLNISGCFVAQYCGNIGRTHGIEDITKAAELLLSEPEFQFMLIGWGAKKQWALQQKSGRNLDNLAILDPLPWNELCDGLNACDVSIISFASGMAGISVPSRMYNVFAAGKPVIAVCDEDSELAEVVKEEAIGWVIPPGRPDLIVAAMREAKASPSRLKAMGERARRAAEAKYTIRNVLHTYRAVIAGLPL